MLRTLQKKTVWMVSFSEIWASSSIDFICSPLFSHNPIIPAKNGCSFASIVFFLLLNEWSLPHSRLFIIFIVDRLGFTLLIYPVWSCSHDAPSADVATNKFQFFSKPLTTFSQPLALKITANERFLSPRVLAIQLFTLAQVVRPFFPSCPFPFFLLSPPSLLPSFIILVWNPLDPSFCDFVKAFIYSLFAVTGKFGQWKRLTYELGFTLTIYSLCVPTKTIRSRFAL